MLKSWLVNSVAVWLVAQFLPGFTVNGLWGAFKVAALFGLLNWAIGWFIYGALGVASLGLGFVFVFITRTVTNAILLKLTDAFSESLNIKGLLPAIFGALLISGIGTVAESVIRHLHWL